MSEFGIAMRCRARAGLQVLSLLASSVNTILDVNIADLNPVAAMLSSAPADVHSTLLGLVGGPLPDDLTAQAERGVPGRRLIAEDLRLVQFKPLRPLMAEEIVAIQDGEGELRYAVVTDVAVSGDDAQASPAVPIVRARLQVCTSAGSLGFPILQRLPPRV